MPCSIICQAKSNRRCSLAAASWKDKPITAWPAGETLFTSWILLLGLIPVDRHHFRLREVHPGRGFDEDSTSSMNRFWRHQREVHAHGETCRVSDRVEFQSRLGPLGILLLPVYRAVFAWRHYRLRRQFR